MEFTGERVVEGKTPRRTWLDHIARYEFASKYVRAKTVFSRKICHERCIPLIWINHLGGFVCLPLLNHTALSEVL